MELSIELLELSPEELETARERVRALAYRKWCEAGCPADDSEFYWHEAERQWIEHEYIPHRTRSR